MIGIGTQTTKGTPKNPTTLGVRQMNTLNLIKKQINKLHCTTHRSPTPHIVVLSTTSAVIFLTRHTVHSAIVVVSTPNEIMKEG